MRYGSGAAITASMHTSPGKWTCPMHPEILNDSPGTCPSCGMALEPASPKTSTAEDPELQYMKTRFLVSIVLTIPLVIIAMRSMIPGGVLLDRFFPGQAYNWAELILASPVVLWCAWPFFYRAWQSIRFRSMNMFTLISRYRCQLRIQPYSAAVPRGLPFFSQGYGGVHRSLFRGLGCHYQPRAPGQVLELKHGTRLERP
jgi:Cu+-exporting ATPase